jgi:hypothetical protein
MWITSCRPGDPCSTGLCTTRSAESCGRAFSIPRGVDRTCVQLPFSCQPGRTPCGRTCGRGVDNAPKPVGSGARTGDGLWVKIGRPHVPLVFPQLYPQAVHTRKRRLTRPNSGYPQYPQPLLLRLQIYQEGNQHAFIRPSGPNLTVRTLVLLLSVIKHAAPEGHSPVVNVSHLA